MNPQLIKIPVPNNPFPNRQFCVEFDNALLTHVDSENAYPSDQYVNVIHEGKEVVAGIDKQLQKDQFKCSNCEVIPKIILKSPSYDWTGKI